MAAKRRIRTPCITRSPAPDSPIPECWPDIEWMVESADAKAISVCSSYGRGNLKYHGITNLPADKVTKAKRRPSDYLRTNVYVDTMGFNERGVRAATAMCGIHWVVFGTDYGPVPISPREHVAIASAAAKGQEERDKSLWRSADQAFNPGLERATLRLGNASAPARQASGR